MLFDLQTPIQSMVQWVYNRAPRFLWLCTVHNWFWTTKTAGTRIYLIYGTRRRRWIELVVIVILLNKQIAWSIAFVKSGLIVRIVSRPYLLRYFLRKRSPMLCLFFGSEKYTWTSMWSRKCFDIKKSITMLVKVSKSYTVTWLLECLSWWSSPLV